MNKNKISRIDYTCCPLCDGKEVVAILRAENVSQHNAYAKGMPDTMTWLDCKSCGHTFVSGYFNQAGMDRLMLQEPDAQAYDSQLLETLRSFSSQIIKRVNSFGGGGTWLDIGFGPGALLITAKEFGYECTGLDLRKSCVDKLSPYIADVRTQDFLTLPDKPSFNVISMADVLEHIPFPREFLSKAHEVLLPNGILYLSMPNKSAPIFSMLTAAGDNAYWAELEHFHNFNRETLYLLLTSHGFEVLDYAVSQRYRAGMEIISRKVENA